MEDRNIGRGNKGEGKQRRREQETTETKEAGHKKPADESAGPVFSPFTFFTSHV
jgi:hypothetical protein